MRVAIHTPALEQEMKKMMPLTDAIFVATGLERHRVTGQRWANDGLRTYVVGGRRLTTVEDVREFIDSRSKPPCAAKAVRSAAKRKRDQARAEKSLKKLGA
ncbi:DUF1580 domain-containing protein [Novipirellula rosea]|uniref:Uncharacterized protein n=1 Tax=Novipirellula rosea TaxID=1031540 RepID=A0ABP8M8X3_9BACT